MSEQTTLMEATFDHAEAGRLKADGMEKALRAERVAVWKEMAQTYMDSLHEGDTLTADDLTAAIGLPDVGSNRNNVVGAWFNAQAKAGHIEPTGRVRQSQRAERRGSIQREWRRV